jgi:hypothetical protein
MKRAQQGIRQEQRGGGKGRTEERSEIDWWDNGEGQQCAGEEEE